MNEKIKVLGHRVKQLRLAYGVSQTKMAKAIETSQTNLSNMEAGRTAITTQNLFKIREVLGCKMSDFFVDFDNEIVAEKQAQGEGGGNGAIALEDAVQILKLLKVVEIKGL